MSDLELRHIVMYSVYMVDARCAKTLRDAAKSRGSVRCATRATSSTRAEISSVSRFSPSHVMSPNGNSLCGLTIHPITLLPLEAEAEGAAEHGEDDAVA